MTAYYNEIDPYCAAWLRNLIDAKLIAPGEVDERSIEDVTPDDLAGTFTQSHFFAGIGIWSHALRAAGWDDSRPVWTGSCPCQPFSSAGKGAGFTDERHLWPAFYHLISVRRPDTIFGEQVAGKDGLAWLDLIQTDLEALDYACGAVPMAAAGFGAPEIRERLYWVAHSNESGFQGRPAGQRRAYKRVAGQDGLASFGLANPDNTERRTKGASGNKRHGQNAGRAQSAGDVEGHSGVLRMEHSDKPSHYRQESSGGEQQVCDEYRGCDQGCYSPCPTNGYWGSVDWLLGTDGYFRPVEPGTFPLADGVANRMDKLRAYGNAIIAPQATAFIEAAMEYAP